ncbi:MAG TPA: hypothetical protein DDY38_07400 [Firmicutes bacterium]|nr:hypothetical protein [Bacillota bacterium]
MLPLYVRLVVVWMMIIYPQAQHNGHGVQGQGICAHQELAGRIDSPGLSKFGSGNGQVPGG